MLFIINIFTAFSPYLQSRCVVQEKHINE